MKNLQRHELNSQLVFEYIRDVVSNVNALSFACVKLMNLSDGKFFTLLPENADIERLYKFKSWILKQNPILEYEDGSKSKYQIIPTIQEEVCRYVSYILNKNKKLKCVVDDFNSTYKTGYSDDFFDSFGLFYENEVYYLVGVGALFESTFLKCLQYSNTFWHSLCVVTEANFDDIVDKNLSLEKIQQVCQEAKLIIIGAYDGEGYLFWEPSSHENRRDFLSKSPTRKFSLDERVLIDLAAPLCFHPGEIGSIDSVIEKEEDFILREGADELANRYIVQLKSGEKIEVPECWLIKYSEPETSE